MTFSIAAYCERSGMFGAAVTTSSIAVGGRCSFARAGCGAVLTQHRTDPRLGPQTLDLLAAGMSAADAIAAVAESTPDRGWRQLAAVDRNGSVAFFHGDKLKPIFANATGRGVVAIGNILRDASVCAAQVAAFERAPERPLAARLLDALEAGLATGGEARPLRSAALLVVAQQSFPYIDLRVDDADAPLTALRRLWTAYEPLADDFERRAIEPHGIGPAPSTA
jgi:uncharacterized Ntn-hydrolase superfamily protein